MKLSVYLRFLRVSVVNFLLIITIQQSSFSAIWQVGPTHTYTLPSQVSTLVQPGDTVEIDAGMYASDVAHWTANNLFLKGKNGVAQLYSGGLSWGDKAIWVISGDNTTVENIEFAEATSTSNNGAGIRQEGHNLTVSHCRFLHNEDGILAGAVHPSKIIVEYSEFGYNGFGDGYTHNIYIGNIDTLIFRYNYSHHTSVGHEVKSRAYYNFILYNRISDEDSCDASRSIDLPNGGTAYIIGNAIEQGPQSQNSNIIGYGLEGLTNPAPHEVYAINNTIVNDRSNGSFFQFETGTSLFKGYNNIIAGPGNFITGSIPSSVDTASNIINTSIPSFNFVDPVNYDYHLNSISSLVIDLGISPGTILFPDMEYLHPCNEVLRCVSGNLDIGAFEYCSPASVYENHNNNSIIYYDGNSGKLTFKNINENYSLKIFNIQGALLKSWNNISLNSEYDLLHISTGIYLLILENEKRRIINKIFMN